MKREFMIRDERRRRHFEHHHRHRRPRLLFPFCLRVTREGRCLVLWAVFIVLICGVAANAAEKPCAFDAWGRPAICEKIPPRAEGMQPDAPFPGADPKRVQAVCQEMALLDAAEYFHWAPHGNYGVMDEQRYLEECKRRLYRRR